MIFIFLVFLIIMIGLYTYAYFSPKLELTNIGQMYIYDKEDNLIYQGSGSSEWVNLEDISPYLINAIISVEDKNFYKHQGFDYLRIAKAMVLNIKSGSIVQGASTISQQYIKNMYLDFDQTWKRKIEEAFLTLQLEVHYDKDDILEGYLNTINFGAGNYGILNASKYYFNKDASELTLEEAIMLAGIPKNPSNYNPVSNYDECINRAKTVALTMLNNDMIDEETYNNLFQDKIEIYGKRDSNNLQMLMYYQDAVLEELETLKGIPTSLLDSGSLKIYTNLDMDAQSKLESEILSNVEDENLQVAGIMIDPDSGAVLALTGGMDYQKSQYNRATQAKRQVGSTMKPFLYYAALENGLTSSSTFCSEPTNFVFSNNKIYSPSNYNDIYANQNITMAAALAYSDNIYAVKTHLFLGEETLVNTAKKAGITGTLTANPSLALGTSELSMIDFATGYTTLASGGFKMDNYFIRKVEDLEGNVLYEHKTQKKLVLNANYVYILNEMLSNTSNSKFKSYTTPTALSIASKMSKKYALKTGTTNTDYWTVGYNSDALLMLWLGYDDASELNSKASTWAKNIWVNTIEDYLKDEDDNWYTTPDNVIGILEDPVTGEIASDNSATVFYYEKGSEVTVN
jgi:1A family penicillin-binding protein